MAEFSQILQNIITRKYQFCSLCLKEIQEDSVSIYDEVLLKENDMDSAIKMFDVLTYILGCDTCNNISTFEFLCKQCTRSAVTCYKFILTCKKNSEFLTNAVCSLNDCFKTVVTSDDAYDCKTVFVTLDSNNLSTQQYYHNEQPTSTSDAFEKFQSKLYIDSKFHIKTETPRKKKRRDYFTFPIKTSEMLYDKNDRTNLKCKSCFKTYPSLSNLRNHYIRVHAPKNYKCSICNRKFGSAALLESHKSYSHCTLVCTECGKTFGNRHTLKMHELGHILKIVCQDCGRIYKSQSTFKKHIDLNICSQKTRASPANAKFTCDYCNKKYTQKVSLRVHIQFEHGNYKGHECKWCKKKFWAKSRLDAHAVKHTQEKKFQCSLCGGKYVSKESLLYHTRTHTGERPYKCDFCDSRFLSASRKVDHIKRHHSDETFQCNICNVKYTTKLTLEKHKKTHEKSKSALHLQIPDQIHITEGDEIFLEVTDEEDFSIPNI